MNIRQNYQIVLERITKAAESAGRDPSEIHLVVVTKTQTVDKIQEAIEAGALDLGENYIEDAIPKIGYFKDTKNINWHMIGHVQSRKSLLVCQYFNYLHSLDSVKLANRIDKFAGDLGKTLPVWLEFNTSGEESKSGWNIWNENNWSAILSEIESILSLTQIKLLGLMTMPPYSINPDDSRPYFLKLRKFQEFMSKHFNLTGFDGLSMGMSGDFEVAIQEGSTCVRIGQAIFGQRN
jgi:pyridoxal phosphate enzyme (YggS family)